MLENFGEGVRMPCPSKKMELIGKGEKKKLRKNIESYDMGAKKKRYKYP